MSGPDSNYPLWLAKADNDFQNIQNNLEARQVPWNTVCFHAQQAAGKLLKALLVYQCQVPSRTHDPVALLAPCVAHEEDLRILEEDCRKLTVFAVGSRYRDDLF